MLRMSKLTDYGTVVLAYLASTDHPLRTTTDVASHTRLSVPTASKLLKLLTRAGLVKSSRGTHGGYALARPADRISAAEIIDALEGPVAITECSGRDSHCEIERVCQVGRAWQKVNVAIRNALGDITLAELAAPLSFGGGNLEFKVNRRDRPTVAVPLGGGRHGN